MHPLPHEFVESVRLVAEKFGVRYGSHGLIESDLHIYSLTFIAKDDAHKEIHRETITATHDPFNRAMRLFIEYVALGRHRVPVRAILKEAYLYFNAVWEKDFFSGAHPELDELKLATEIRIGWKQGFAPPESDE